MAGKKNTGKPAENEFNAWIKRKGKAGYLYEFPDTAKIKGMIGPKGFTLAQPADRLICVDGVLMMAEVKSTTHATRFSKSHIRTSQWAAAVQLTVAGGPYFFFIRRELDKQWFRVPASFFIDNERPSWTWIELSPFHWNLS